MSVSIVTPSYNQGAFIERTVLSVLAQSYPHVEYLVMDGGSTDETVAILQRYSDRVVWESQRDRGQSAAINKGLRLATGDIVAFLNSDDTYAPDALARVVAFFQRNPDKKWVYGKCRIVDEHDHEIRRAVTFYKNLLAKRYSFRRLLTENFISQPATFWRRELLDEIGFFSEGEHLCMDYEYWLRVGEKYPPGFIDEYLANFRYHAQGKSVRASAEQLRDQQRLARRHGQRYPLTLLVGRLNYYKILAVYGLLARFERTAKLADDARG